MIHLRKEGGMESGRERGEGKKDTSECVFSAKTFSPSLRKAQHKAELFEEHVKYLEELEFAELD